MNELINFIAFSSVVLMVVLLLFMSIYLFITEALKNNGFDFKMFLAVILSVIAVLGLYFNSIK